jgi:two-component system, OmpR family, sensor histidine kinase KdpD
VYLVGVLLVALRGQQMLSFFMSLLSVLAFDFCFIPPRFSFVVSDTQYFISLLVMLIIAQVISHFAILRKRQTERVRLRENRNNELLTLSKLLATTRGADALLQIATRHIAEIFDSHVLALLPDQHSQLVVRSGYPFERSLDAKALSIAQWAYDLKQPAGLGTQTLSVSQAVYLPLSGSTGTLGILMVEPHDPKRLLQPEQMHLLEALIHQITLALEADH